VLLFFVALLYSCKEDEQTGGSVAYDPGKPVALETFRPEVGGMATRVILTGSNLGNDPSAVKVYFNNKPAPVVGCDKGKILAITPRQPGDTCIISVVIGKDSSVFKNKFIYNTTTVVTTVVGQKGTTEFKAGSFAEATFRNPTYLAVDDEYNLFLSHQDSPNCIALISQQNSTVTQLVASDKPNAPSTDITGRIIVVPLDPLDGYYEFDPDAQWAPRRRAILHPTAEEQAAGVPDFTINAYKHGFAVCFYDSMVYTRSNRDGYLVKFNPKTRLGQSVVINGKKMVCNPNNTDSYLVFDPILKTRLYVSSSGQHCIHYFDILTGETGIYAGRSGQSGWKDGKKEDAQFNSPRQIIFDINNNLLVADQNNHCIRRISPEGTVSTVVGIAGKSGYLDGNPDDALFNQPWGLAIDKDYTIYVADRGNNCIRKLTIE
jgi:hypothetical protein